MSQEPQSNPAAAIVEFCRFVAQHGLPAGVKETLRCLRAVEAVGVADRTNVKLALRSVLCSSKDDWDAFDNLFQTFWSQRRTATSTSHAEKRTKLSTPPHEQRGSLELLGFAAQGRAEDGEGKAVTGAAAIERLRQIDFSQIAQNDLPELERLALQLLRRMALRLSRRLRTMQRRGPVDLRRTIHRNISRGGDPVYLSHKGRRKARARLVILLDVSGSMNAYSLFLARLAYALTRHFRRVNTFLFSTQLQEVTAALRNDNLSQALAALSQEPTGWSGGTRIGESLRDFNQRAAGKLLSRDTLVLILSDGWDTGEPELLAGELSAIRRRSRQIVWLNPLLGMKDYQPLTRGMSAALPHIDVFAAAHNLESLLELGHLLGRANRRRFQSLTTAGNSNA
jgi:uncharacterized protein with von Willebrand factor type A (vWA) domain